MVTGSMTAAVVVVSAAVVSVAPEVVAGACDVVVVVVSDAASESPPPHPAAIIAKTASRTSSFPNLVFTFSPSGSFRPLLKCLLKSFSILATHFCALLLGRFLL
jgi:hypothetical protein